MGGRIYLAGPLARGRHAAGVVCRRTERRTYGHFVFKISTESRNQVGAGNQKVLIDGLTDGSLPGSRRQAFLAVDAAHGHCLEVDVEIQDGVDVDVVSLPGGNLVTGAVGDSKSVHDARRGWPRSRVVAKRNWGSVAFTF